MPANFTAGSVTLLFCVTIACNALFTSARKLAPVALAIE
jgi:hypothetical protein